MLVDGARAWVISVHVPDEGVCLPKKIGLFRPAINIGIGAEPEAEATMAKGGVQSYSAFKDVIANMARRRRARGKRRRRGFDNRGRRRQMPRGAIGDDDRSVF